MWVKVKIKHTCPICKGVTGWWVRQGFRTVWITCECCNGAGKLEYDKVVWRTEDEH